MTAVLFDFSGTLFRVESTESWLRGALAEAGIELPEPELTETAQALETAGALPGGADPERLPTEVAEVWDVRDQSSELHRAAYTGLSRQVPLPDPGLHDALYDRHMRPAAWAPYPDAAEVLHTLRERGIPVGVVSNIGWDLRPVFREHGLDPYIDVYVLSYEHGIRKPDPRLFATACAKLGVEPRDALMVGDNRRADGGAATLGCGVHFVDHLPVALRPDGLRPVLDLVG
ncbi:HAD-IA family hydrolase [Streptomyces sp. DG2A-72]|uniref:HAD family hydrolase n=1 Tax=Streptomyces sp. DG2A-72 TaxID=3051386 RepID=UPI00265BE6A9|nr:HAD family hydrolase [Streptomyces sp. DG2A-72]MDO0931048.1 HAD-IA family hydrolase [Streptomyces sp. DG2A-72]